MLALWELLRSRTCDSANVALAGSSTHRRFTLDVTVDDREANALGVMSQGELHAVALVIFLPRATLQASPFRFVIIDDPVQSMDPSRIDGLAQCWSPWPTTGR